MRRWVGFALLLAVLPLFASKGFALTLISRIGIMAIFALSYNLLLGETGLLSFGHAVHYGLGAFGALHLLNAWRSVPVTLLPLFGGLCSLAFALVFGYALTRRAGVTFAMISLGIGEMVAASSLMFPDFFGGEAGISANRVTGKGLLGIDYGSPLQMYFLIAAWLFLCTAAMHALTRTPLGRLANAVRDNPQRVEFIGYDPARIRFLVLALSGFFAGIAGALSGLLHEIVTAEAVGDYNSGIVILMAFVGGTASFAGPIAGAALVTVLQVAVASVTPAWPFYFGLFFLAIVLYAPGGIASIFSRHEAVFRASLMHRLLPAYLLAALPAGIFGFGIVALVELAYARNGEGHLRLLGVPLDGDSLRSWFLAASALAIGFFLLRIAARRIGARWEGVHAALQGGP